MLAWGLAPAAPSLARWISTALLPECRPLAAAALHCSAAAEAPPRSMRGASQPAQPLSQALVRLEELLSSPNLPLEQVKANQEAVSALRSFLGRLAAARPGSYPPAGIQRLVFYPPPDAFKQQGGGVGEVRLTLKTTGGDCSQLAAGNVARLLEGLGLRGSFFFDIDGLRPPPPEDPAAAAAAAQKAAAAAGFPSQGITEEELEELESQREGRVEAEREAADWADKLGRLDPLLAALAAVPWLQAQGGTDDRVGFIQTTVLDQLESQGWDLRRSVQRIWAGERGTASELAAGKDPGTQAAVQSILFHAIRLDKEHGRQVLPASDSTAGGAPVGGAAGVPGGTSVADG